jgi:DNA polymerase III epsilon subunit family exonuclease
MSFSLLQSLRDVALAFIDVETTGASAEYGDRVIEVGVVRYACGQKVAEYQQLVDPQRRISAGVIALTGITPDMVAGRPTFDQQLPAMLEMMRGAAVLGHNVRFDLSFLRKEFRRGGFDLVAALENAPVFDTVRIARRRFGRGGNGLQRLASRLGIYPTCAHRALADAITTGEVFEKLMEPIGGWALKLCDAMLEQGGPMNLMPQGPRESLLPLELEEALEQRTPVLMEYVDGREQRTQRVIEPLQIRRRAGELVLVAYCQLRNDRRSFKLDRIVQLTRLTPEQLKHAKTAPPCPQQPGDAAPEPDSSPDSVDARPPGTSFPETLFDAPELAADSRPHDVSRQP